MEKIGTIAKIRIGMIKGSAHRHAVGEGGNGANLGEQQSGRPIKAMPFRIDLQHIGMEAGYQIQHCRQNSHWGRPLGKPGEMLLKIGMQWSMLGQSIAKLFQSFGIGKLTIDKQRTYFDETCLVGYFFDGITAIAQNPVGAVDVGNIGITGSGVSESGVHGDIAGLCP